MAGAISIRYRQILMRRCILLLVVLGLGAIYRASAAERVLPENIQSMPILIQIPKPDQPDIAHYGSGIILEESNKDYIVTAAHVLFQTESNRITDKLIGSNAVVTALTGIPESKDKYVWSIDLNRVAAQGLIKRHLAHDVAVIQLNYLANTLTNGLLNVNTMYGIVITQKPSLPQMSFVVGNDLIIPFNDIQDGSETFLMGYPVELLNNKLASEVDYGFPLIRKGIISQKNLKTNKLIIDSGVYGGNSGGPVLIATHPNSQITSFKIVGIITQFVPYQTRINPDSGITNEVLVNSGYGVAEPIDYALELMRQ